VVSDTIDHMVEIMPADAKFRRLLGLLGQWGDKGQMLVFVDRQENADELFVALREHGNNAMPLHGGLDQADRESTIRCWLTCTSFLPPPPHLHSGITNQESWTCSCAPQLQRAASTCPTSALSSTSTAPTTTRTTCTVWAARAEQVPPPPYSLQLVVAAAAHLPPSPPPSPAQARRARRTRSSRPSRSTSPPTSSRRWRGATATYRPRCSRRRWQAVRTIYSRVQVPQDLREMLGEFKKKIKEGGAKQHKGSGFGGRGFKFDTSEQVKHER
jgi:hypothetical protein